MLRQAQHNLVMISTARQAPGWRGSRPGGRRGCAAGPSATPQGPRPPQAVELVHDRGEAVQGDPGLGLGRLDHESLGHHQGGADRRCVEAVVQQAMADWQVPVLDRLIGKRSAKAAERTLAKQGVAQ